MRTFKVYRNNSWEDTTFQDMNTDDVFMVFDDGNLFVEKEGGRYFKMIEPPKRDPLDDSWNADCVVVEEEDFL